MEIREVSYGIANNFGDYIEVNKNLKEYPLLYRQVMAHEYSHTNEKGFTKEDFMLDYGTSNVHYGKLLVFIIRHPKALVQFLPFYITRKRFVYDINLIIAWVSVLGIIGIAVLLSIYL
jgi:hypothetical protein